MRKTAVIESEKEIPTRSTVMSYGVVVSLVDTIRKMTAGQSFVVDGARARRLALTVGNRLNIKLTSARETQEPARYRIWRKE